MKKVIHVQDMRDDTLLLNDLKPADADDLYYAIVRQYGKGTYKDSREYDGPGSYGTLKEFLAKTTLVNVAKVAQLASRGEFIFRTWADTLVGRRADKRNKCIGNELANLIVLADKHYASEEEHTRFVDLYKRHASDIRMALCSHYRKGGNCHAGDTCRFMHLHDRDL